ncbi:hypothetical protein MCEMIE11_00280 [Burkholderiales bacterium]
MRFNALSGITAAALAIAPVLPNPIAKVMVAIGIFSLISQYVIIEVKFRLLWSFIVVILLVPGFTQALLFSPSDAIRFVYIIIALLVYSSNRILFDYRTLKYLSGLCIIYLVSTQILLALGVTSVTAFRDTYYPLADNPWNYGIIEKVSFEYRYFRAGGLFYNPNVLGLILLLYGFIYVYTSILSCLNSKTARPPIVIKRRSLITLMDLLVITTCLLGSYLTGSRTVLLGCLVLIFLVFYYKALLYCTVSRTRIYLIVGVLSAIGIIAMLFIFEEAFFVEDGSVSIKFSILFEHLKAQSLFGLLFGGSFDIQFDAEIGYWVGAAGLLGATSIFLFLLVIGLRSLIFLPITMMYLTTSVGNSVLYGLLTGVLMLLVIMAGFNMKTVYSNE